MPDTDDINEDATEEVQETEEVEETEETEEVTEDEPTEEPDGDDEDDDEVFDKSRAMAKIRKANREAENLRKRLKQAEADSAELKKIKDSQKSDSERLTDRATAAEAKVLELQRQVDLKTIQAEFGLTDAQVARLNGNDLDSLRSDAEDFIEENKITKPAKKAGPSAREVSGGREPRTPKQTLDPVKLAEKVRRR